MFASVRCCIIVSPVMAAGAAVTVNVDWSSSWRTVSTAATFEVDHMPFLSRVQEGGTFDGYYTALENLNASYVRFAPWYPYPKVAVAELYPADCKGKGSSFNTTLLDGVMQDFMQAVCGPDAKRGVCDNGHSVVPMITTIPAWMYDGGDDKIKEVPEDPWQFPSGGFSYYLMGGKPLKDPTCKQMAEYAARIVEWYTAGGTTDECGVRHESGLRYNWWGVSVLNENEYHTPPDHGVQYTICWDAWLQEIRKVNADIVLVGPETVSDLGYSQYFLNGSNHVDGKPPPVVANHMGLNGPPYSNFFTGLDSWVDSFGTPLDEYRRKVAPDAEMIMNEYIPFNSEWCEGAEQNGCPDWTHSSAKGTKINRKTIGWNAAAASFAYGYGRMAELGYKYVGADQLVSGAWPDNEPAVASLDWDTGEPNAKYWAVRMLASELGPGRKALFRVSVTRSTAPYPKGLKRDGNCGITAYSDDCDRQSSGAWNTTQHNMTTLDDCVAKCQGCAMCNYVSFSLDPGHQDCSWYRTCDMDALGHLGNIYQSEAVHPERDQETDFYALGLEVQGRKKVLIVSKSAQPETVKIAGATGLALVLEGVGEEPGFMPPTSKILNASGEVSLGSYAVAVITLDADIADTVYV